MQIRSKYIIIQFIAINFLLSSCIEEFWPDLGGKYENAVVFDGMITNDPGPYYIKISLSNTVGNSAYIPLSGYRVVISDDHGNSEILQETAPGTYATSPNGIQGTIGYKYRLQALSPEGKDYQSEYEELKMPVEIDSVFAKFEFKEDTDINPKEGYQFYLNTYPSADSTNYFIWRLESTYEYETDFKLRFYYVGTIVPVTNSDSLQTCWKTDKIKEFFTFSTKGLTEQVVKNFPLIYVNTDDRTLSIRYSLMVRQYTVSEKSYQFWTNIREQNAGGDELYTRQPFQVRGNIINPGNSNEPVFGYFLVAGISKQRIFVDRPTPPVHFYYSICELTQWDYENYGTVFRSSPDEWPIFITTGLGGSRAYPVQDCIDCRLSGGTIEKPSFWLEQ